MEKGSELIYFRIHEKILTPTPFFLEPIVLGHQEVEHPLVQNETYGQLAI
jgi:hypothetical protein